jgi:hypothetical protein
VVKKAEKAEKAEKVETLAYFTKLVKSGQE